MIREQAKTTDGRSIELVRPETEADTSELKKASELRNVDTGTSLADLNEVSDADLEAVGLLQPDEEE